MRFYYLSFKEWKNLDKDIKNSFVFLSTAYTVPIYWNGKDFLPFVPSEELFKDACIDFKRSNFEERYKKQIFSLDRNKILKQLKEKYQNKDIVFLVWEDETKGSERDIFIPWLTNSSIKDIKNYSFLRRLNDITNESSILFDL